MAFKSYYSHLNDFDSDYFDVSSAFNDTHEFLNVAFIESPKESLCLQNDSPLSNLSLLLYFKDDSMRENKEDYKTRALSEDEDMTKPSYKNLSDLNYPDEIFEINTSTEEDSKPCGTIKHSSLANEKCNNDSSVFQLLPKWKYTHQYCPEMNTSSCQNPVTESFAEISSIGNDSVTKFEKRPVGIEKKKFGKDSGSAYLPKLTPEMCEKNSVRDYVPEVQTAFEFSNLIRYLVLETECESVEIDNKFGRRNPLRDYVYHELSTIQEFNPSSTDEISESLTSSNVCEDLGFEDSDSKAIPKVCKPSASDESFLDIKFPPLPLNVLKVIQNKRIEKLLQERGILEESDLTLIPNEFSNASSKYLEKSVKPSESRSICKLNSSYNKDSPSLISFLQHEMSCMEE